MKIQCPECGNSITVNGLGRKSLNIAVKNVYDAIQHNPSVTLAAAELGCSRAYIYKVLKAEGKTAKEILAK